MSKQNLKALQSKWYRKLKQSGFKDIEDTEGRLISWSGSSLTEEPLASRIGYASRVHKESQAEYYRLAGQFLHDKKFPNRLSKDIWALHASGLSLKSIAEKLNMPRATVQHRIEKLRKLFYANTY